MPKRIQRKRVKGWRIPENAACCTRPGVFGNPFVINQPDHPLNCPSPKEAVLGFRRYLKGTAAALQWCPGLKERRERLLARLPELFGKDLACFCAEDAEWCHVDELIPFVEKRRVEAAKGRAA